MAVRINLEAGCAEACAPLVERTYNQLNAPMYSRGASVLALPPNVDLWRAQHRTARKRADRSRRLGYRFAETDWSRHDDDIYEINTSLSERQGRPMNADYFERKQNGRIGPQPCGRHRVHTYGVLQHDRLRAYMSLYRVGELAHVSMILGHGDHLEADIMYLLVAGVVEHQAPQGGFMFYNRHDSGTEGLRFYKERLGFAPEHITWALA